MKPRLFPKYVLLGIAVTGFIAGAASLSLFFAYRAALEDAIGVTAKATPSLWRDWMVQHAVSLGAPAAERLADPLARGDLDALAAELAAARQASGADLLVVRDSAGDFVAASGDRALDPGGVADGLVDAQRLHASIPIEQAGKRLGTLQQVFASAGPGITDAALRGDLAAIRAAGLRDAAQRLAAVVLASLALVAVIAGGVARRQRRTIQALVAGAERLAGGDFSAALPRAGGDEFGKLAGAFDRMREQLRSTLISRDYLDRVLGSMPDAIVLTAGDGAITRVNAAASRLLEYPEQALVGRPVTDLVAPAHRAHFDFRGERRRVSETLLVTRSGREVPISYTGATLPASESIAGGCVIAARNITERKLAEQRIRYLARIDALTKVPNRMQFQHLLQRAIARAQRQRIPLALLYVDVDRFKDVNDTFGHAAGDTCLEVLAARATKLLPPGGFMGRLAGDEFGLVVELREPAAGRQAWIQSLGRRLIADIGELVIVNGHEIYITASIGVATFPVDADNVLDLIRNADAALYHAKRAGGKRLEFYTPDMNAAAVERLMLKSKLRRSFELDELLVNYQPKIDVATGMIVGAEALVRWDLSEHGLVLPSQFIPLAEETGLILEIGEWVLNRVCADIVQWRQAGVAPGRISVNLSLKQLGQQNFARRLNRILRRHAVAPEQIELEITETTVMADPAHTVRVLRELRALGLHLAIDDFGTGYSSLSALQQFPIGTLKIDQSFVRDAATDADDATLVSTIVEMGHSLKMRVVAEGVESEEQLGFLRTLGCDYVQGLLFGAPMTADNFIALLRSQDDGTGSYRALFG